MSLWDEPLPKTAVEAKRRRAKERYEIVKQKREEARVEPGEVDVDTEGLINDLQSFLKGGDK